jgi:nucleotide-binding universal stress UspA family protein
LLPHAILGASAVKNILVCLDGSSRAPDVLATAVRQAESRDAKLILFRSVGVPADLPHDYWKTTEQPLLEVLEGRARDYLASFATNVPRELAAECEVAVGVPWQAICDAARNRHADLVVIGSHGYSGIDRLLGTTAGKVVNHAPCSVLVARDTSGPPH